MRLDNAQVQSLIPRLCNTPIDQVRLQSIRYTYVLDTPSLYHRCVPYPCGFFVCQFHRSRHITSNVCGALNPSSFSASVGSAVRSGTSPRLSSVTFSSLRNQHCFYAPPANDLILVVESSSFPHRIDNLENTHPPTLAEVVSLVASLVGTVVKDLGVWRERIEGKQVPRRQVEHMKIVPDTGTIPGWISLG